MKLLKLAGITITITIVATLLIKADQILSRDGVEQTKRDPVVFEADKDQKTEIDNNESLLVEKIEKLTSRINELEAELINQQAEKEAVKINEQAKVKNPEEEKELEKKTATNVQPEQEESTIPKNGPAPRAEPVISSDLFPNAPPTGTEPPLPSFSPDTQARHDFGEALNPYGEWMGTQEYGEVWKPRIQNSPNWAPYTVGRWHYTELGWHFTSAEPWGWACYHYGRWVRYRSLGWCWVPGREWAPAWVSWRTSPNHIGWSPLPPRATWNHHSGIRHWADSRFNIGPSHYSFLRVEDFSSRNCRNSLISRRQNTSLMLSTNNVTLMFSISLGGKKRICNRGPDRNFLVKHHRQDHRPLRITRSRAEKGCVNQVNVINQEIVIHQRVKNERPIHQSRSQSIRKINNDKIDEGWSELSNNEQKTVLRRHIGSDSNKNRRAQEINPTILSNNNPPIRQTKDSEVKGRVSNVVVPNLVETKTKERQSRVTAKERQRQELARKQAQDEKLRQSQEAQKQIEDQKVRVTANERQRQELARKQAQDEKLRQSQEAQKQIEDQKVRVTAKERERQELARKQAQDEKLRQSQEAQKQIEAQKARTTAKERERQELAQRKAQVDRIRQSQAAQKQIEDQKSRVTIQERQRQELAQRKAQVDRIKQTQAAQKQIEDQRRRSTVQERQRQESAQRKAQVDRIRQAQTAQKQIEDQRRRIAAQELQRQERSNSFAKRRPAPKSSTQRTIKNSTPKTINKSSKSFSRNIPSSRSSSKSSDVKSAPKSSKSFSRNIKK